MSPPFEPLVLEPYTPMSHSLEWRIGAAFWRRQGSAAFQSGAVPHLGTTDGMLAARAADVFFHSCLEASRHDALEDEVQVVELGAGLGLFARLFLNRLQQRCQDAGMDFYDRVRYFVTDQSPKMLADLAAARTLDRHGDHVHLGLMDAQRPGTLVDPNDGTPRQMRGLRALLHTYVLDTLPFEYLLEAKQGWLRMYVMTLIERVEDLSARTGLDRAQLNAMVAGGVEDAMDVLLPVQDLLSLDRAYFPVEVDELPYGDGLSALAAAVRAGDPQFVRVTWPVGALDSVTASLGLLRDDGFLLFADYGNALARTDFLTHQRYGGSRARGVNLAAIEQVVTQQNRDRAVPVRVLRAAGDDDANIHARLLLHGDAPAVEELFLERFDTAVFQTVAELRDKARSAAREGSLEAAQELYARAAALAPENWLLVVEWADFETNMNSNPERGLELAADVAAMNPTCHSIVLAVLGDALLALNRCDEALEAYQRGTSIQPDDVRCWIGKAVCFAEMGRYYDACCQFGSAFGVDLADENREKLLAGLNAVLDARVSARRASRA